MRVVQGVSVHRHLLQVFIILPVLIKLHVLIILLYMGLPQGVCCIGCACFVFAIPVIDAIMIHYTTAMRLN